MGREGREGDDFFPQLRDTLSREFFPAVAGRADARIGEEIAHAKAANPTTLLTSSTQEELRRAPEAGPDAGRGADAGREGILRRGDWWNM